MKKIIGCFLLFSALLFSQSYLNILLSNGSYKNSQVSAVKKITISASGTQINFHLSDETIVTENIADIQRIIFGDIPLGEPLPVELSSFSAILNGASVVLLWSTETEVNNYGFEIERNMRQDSGSERWVKIGFVQGNGNSNSPKDYSFTDSPKGGTKFKYRLKQIDNDGKYEYSNVVNIDIGIPVQYELKQNFPNPFNPATNITYNLPVDGFVSIIVYDVVGREVAGLVNENKKAGIYLVRFNGNNYSSGVYLCRINSGNYSSSIKMTLIK